MYVILRAGVELVIFLQMSHEIERFPFLRSWSLQGSSLSISERSQLLHQPNALLPASLPFNEVSFTDNV